MRVGFVGLGNMGGPMCGHLVSAGFDVTAYDVSDAALARARDAGARGAGSAAECAGGVEVVITMLPAPPQVDEVWRSLIPAMDPGALAIDMSTSSVAVGRRVLEAAKARGVELLDAPVAGQSIGAQAGTLAIYVGGPEAAFARARPLFEAMGDPERIFHLGGHGAGYTVKLLLNLTWFIQSVATGEVLTMGSAPASRWRSCTPRWSAPRPPRTSSSATCSPSFRPATTTRHSRCGWSPRTSAWRSSWPATPACRSS
jgi:3-hydroxyisobutyrate dehydrogenase